MNAEKIARDVQQVYQWIDQQLRNSSTEDKKCQACGACCNFEDYDHRLYVTTPEMIYFRYTIGANNIKPMNSGACPYNVNGKCTVHRHRFAGCRIFFCKSSEDLQSRLSEQSLKKFKQICKDHSIDYNYLELSKTLNRYTVDTTIQDS